VADFLLVQYFALVFIKTHTLTHHSKIRNYCIAMQEHGCDTVHKHIGREPSGVAFNDLSLSKGNIPHNPMINAGAIMACSLIQKDEPLYQRFDHVTRIWSKLAGNKKVSFNNSVYLSERETADRK
jgi:glutaminase